MAFFNKRIKADAKRRNQARPMIVLEAEEGNKALALGLQWSSILVSNPLQAAIKKARDKGATHYAYRGTHLGYSLVNKGEKLPNRIYPALLVASRSMPDAILAVSLGEGEYWLAQTQNGAPTSLDVVFQRLTDAQLLEKAREALASARSVGATPTFYTNIRANNIEGARSIQIEELLHHAQSEDDQLKVLPKAKGRVPKPMVVSLVVLATLVAVQHGSAYFKNAARAKAAQAADQGDADPKLAWDEALNAWKNGVAAPDSRGLTAARNALGTLFVRFDGWTLKSAECNAGAFIPAGERIWVCQASYERSPMGALSRDIVKQLPKEWTVTFTPLNKMDVTWQVAQQGKPLDIEKIQSVNYHKVETASRIQAFSQALVREVKYDFVGLDIPAPRKKDGSAYAPLADLGSFKQATVALHGPLRSMDAAIAADLEISWTKLVINFSGQTAEPNIRNSALTAEAHGIIYAKN